MDLKQKIRDISDFPETGFIFRDITPVLSDPKYFRYMLDQMVELVEKYDYDIVISPESRGFIVGAPLAYISEKGFIPIRKKGKLPYKTINWEYELDKGTASLEIHIDAIKPGQKVLLVDDLLATGGTLFAAAKLIEQLGGSIECIASVIELEQFNGRNVLKEYDVVSLLKY